MKKLFIAAVCAVMAFSGCVSDRNCCGEQPVVPTLNAGGSSFGDEQYIWESWQYGPNRVDPASVTP